MGFGVLQERLHLTLFECREWLRLSREWTRATVEVLPDPPADTAYWVLVNDTRAEVNSGPTPTPASISADLATAIDGLAIPALTVTDDGGTVRLTSTETFTLYLGPLLDLTVSTAEDAMVVVFRDLAISMADDYLNNPFAEVDRQGLIIPGTEKPIPPGVAAGVKQLMAFLWEQNYKDSQATSGGATAGDITMKKVGELTVSYGSTSSTSTSSSQSALTTSRLPQVVRVMLDMYRFAPGAFTPWAPVRNRTPDGLDRTAERTSEEVLL